MARPRRWPRLAALLWLAAGLAGGVAAHAASAGTGPRFPAKPVHLVVAYPPGGTLDVVARLFAGRLSALWGEPVVVENRTGGNGAVGVDVVARSTPDGYTQLFNASFLVVLEQLQPTNFDIGRDLVGVCQTTGFVNVLGVNPALGVRSLPDLVALARQRPGALNYGSGGNGSLLHVYMELFKGSAGIDITHVPYKGSAFAIQALAAGEVDMVFDTSLAMLPLTRAGKVVPVMVTGSRPFRDLPNVPPMAGLFPGVNIDAWHGVFMPAATPRAVVEQVAADLREAVFSPELAPRLADLGLEPLGLGPAAFAQTLREDRLRWQRLIRERHIRAD